MHQLREDAFSIPIHVDIHLPIFWSQDMCLWDVELTKKRFLKLWNNFLLYTKLIWNWFHDQDTVQAMLWEH